MKWTKINFPDQDDWEIQYDITAYYETHKLGSLVYNTEYGWQSVIDGSIECLYNSSTEEEAKEEFKTNLENFLLSQIDYYHELLDMLEELK